MHEIIKSIYESVYTEIIIKVLIGGVIGGSIFTYCNENIDVLRTSFLIENAKCKLKACNPSEQKICDTDSIKGGVQILLEIAIAKPFRKQEMVDIIVTDFFRRYFNKDPTLSEPTPKPMVKVFVSTLKPLLTLPRKDENGHEFNIDLHQMRLISVNDDDIYMQKLNFEGVVLWGSDFEHVDFSRSNFEGSDLGGTYFKNCGLEDLNMKMAKISRSPLDNSRPTIIESSWMSRTSIEESNIYPSVRTDKEDNYGFLSTQLVIKGSDTDIEPPKHDFLSHRQGVEFLDWQIRHPE